MDDLERLLRDSLQREEPPAGFEERVLARVNRPRRPWVRWAGIAAMIAIAGGATIEFEQRRRDREAGEAAKAKLELALKITTEKLHRAMASAEDAGQ